ncbi:hypothetical protein GCM10007049_33670 [Echinicola pacifica]|uniref:Uncharacterized protein n=1 Tax=Echinicola pacifica TaxID=346377 RepID=A0A918QAG0_9BACT|nr:hypothetical protein [Echinicola pacifica]GGZ37706.1 hypothetical protein GCM10007049_33670 [Echinicola pacifica]
MGFISAYFERETARRKSPYEISLTFVGNEKIVKTLSGIIRPDDHFIQTVTIQIHGNT